MLRDVQTRRQRRYGLGRGLSGEVRIGIVPTAAQFLLPPAARQLLAEAPDVMLRTTVALVGTLMPMLRAGEVDLVIGTESLLGASDLSMQLLAEDSIVVAASATHEIFDSPPKLKDLTRHRWVLQPVRAPTRD